MMSDVHGHRTAAPTPELTDADMHVFVSRMSDVRLAEGRLMSALESMMTEDGLLTPTAGYPVSPSRKATRRPKRCRYRHPSGRQFSQAAREGAVAARKAKALIQENLATPRVFIVRHDCPSTPFTWEIRRFGGVILVKGDLGFPSLSMAWAAGEAMLAEASPA